jgi:probable F420-dependent oxidoreductase
VKLAVSLFLTDETPPPDELARLVEQRGFESLWLPEHSHIPASRESAHPAGIDLPREYARMVDPFVALAFAAAATDTLVIGTAVCLVIQRDPIVLAKEVATLDLLSGGRFQFGVGAGWNLEEMRHHGTDPATRFALLDERVEAMKEIWREDEASYDGELVRFDRVWSWPKPLQRPHPPVHVAGNGAAAARRALRIGNGWMPLYDRRDERQLRRVEETLRCAGEQGQPLQVTMTAAPARPDALESLAAAGVSRVIFYLPSSDRPAIESALDRAWAAAASAGLTAPR